MDNTPVASDTLRFTYEGSTIEFQSVSESDAILEVMRRNRTFYEIDVLERIRGELAKRAMTGAAFDVGAFIGTHSLYFAKYCGLAPVFAFEANADTLATLLRNIAVNAETANIVPFNRALGRRSGSARIVHAGRDLQGMTRVIFQSREQGGTVEASTLDLECAQAERRFDSIALIKIDVEGAELEVLAGAKQSISRFRPIICVEVHSASHLWRMLRVLRGYKYCVLDCRGYSPTYILGAKPVRSPRRFVSNFFWLIRAAIPAGKWTDRWLRYYLKRLAQAAISEV